MKFFSKLWRWIRGGVNAQIDKLEDPKKVLKQTIEDMRAEYAETRKAAAEAQITLKKFQREALNYQESAAEFGRKAERAVAQGNDALAREALHRRREFEILAKVYETNISKQVTAVGQFRNRLEEMASEIATADGQKRLLENQIRITEVQQKIAEASSSLLAPSESSAFATFHRLKDKIDDATAAAEIACELSASEINGGGVSLLEGGLSDVDDELAKLKTKLLTEKQEK